MGTFHVGLLFIVGAAVSQVPASQDDYFAAALLAATAAGLLRQ